MRISIKTRHNPSSFLPCTHVLSTANQTKMYSCCTSQYKQAAYTKDLYYWKSLRYAALTQWTLSKTGVVFAEGYLSVLNLATYFDFCTLRHIYIYIYTLYTLLILSCKYKQQVDYIILHGSGSECNQHNTRRIRKDTRTHTRTQS